MRSFNRNCSTMRLKAIVKWPISSCEVTASVRSSSPRSTACAPSSRWRTGLVRPVLTMTEKTSPSAAASAVRTMAVITTVCCLRNVAAESVFTRATISPRTASSSRLRLSRNSSTRWRDSTIAFWSPPSSNGNRRVISSLSWTRVPSVRSARRVSMRTSAAASPKLEPLAIEPSSRWRAAFVSRSTVPPLSSKRLRASA